MSSRPLGRGGLAHGAATPSQPAPDRPAGVECLRRHVDSVSYSADGRTLAGIAFNGRLGLFDLPSRRPTFSFDTKTPGQTEIAFSPDGQTLVTNGGSMVLHSWEIKARRDRFAMPDAHCDPLSPLFITPGGKTIVTATEDGSIRVWDPRDGRQVRRGTRPG